MSERKKEGKETAQRGLVRESSDESWCVTVIQPAHSDETPRATYRDSVACERGRAAAAVQAQTTQEERKRQSQ